MKCSSIVTKAGRYPHVIQTIRDISPILNLLIPLRGMRFVIHYVFLDLKDETQRYKV